MQADQRRRGAVPALFVVKGGSHGWRFAYSLAGRRNILSLGTYPDVSLSQARKRADDARRLVSDGTDPSDVRKAGKVAAAVKVQAERLADAGLPPADSFEAVAREWYDTRRGDWSESYGEKVIARLVAERPDCRSGSSRASAS